MKIKNILIAMATVATLIFAGCTKEKDIVGTNWASSTDVDLTDIFTGQLDEGTAAALLELGGGKVMAKLEMTLGFNDATTGTFSMTLRFEGALADLFGNSSPKTEETTYTFDGTAGTISHGSTGSAKHEFSYNSKDNTITLVRPDLIHVVGDDSFIFNEVK